MKQDTKIVTAGRKAKWTNGVVNPSVTRASTVVFNTVDEMNHALKNRHKQTMVYGTIRSPVNGMMVNLGTVQPIDKGIIQCIEV